MEYIKKALVFLLFSCKKVTALINKSEVVKLSFIEKFIVLYHTTLCRTCNHYEKHSTAIDSAFEYSFNKQNVEDKLSEEKKIIILNQIKTLSS